MSALENSEAITRAANAQKVAKTLRSLTPAGIRALRAEALGERGTTFNTPWEWVDESGLFYGEDGAWLYHTLPLGTVSSDADRLEQLLTDLALALPDRPVHLLMYGWESPAEVSTESASYAHADYIRECLRILVPGHMLVIGVKLIESSEAAKRRAKLRSVFNEIVDRALLEWVPNLSGFDADRERVAAVLARHGGTPVAGGPLDMLESWYTLGVSADLEAIEKDDSILVRGSEMIEFVSVRSFSDEPPPRFTPPPAPGAAGTVVVSARGSLSLSTRHVGGREETIGSLNETSVIVGRRVARVTTILHEACATMAGAQTKPLPMRQIPALAETLPTCATQVDPHLFNVTAEKLRRVGFNEPIPAGDRAGLLVGMVEPDFSYPLYLDLFARPGYVLALAGHRGSGKTFLTEHLAAQAKLEHKRVLFVSSRANNYAVPRHEMATVTGPVEGLLDPFAALDPSLAAHAVLHVLRHALPSLSSEHEAELTRALTRAARGGISSTTAALLLVTDPVLAALLTRFRKSPLGRMMCSTEGGAPVQPPYGLWDVDAILADVVDPTLAQIAADLLAATALARTAGGLAVIDGTGDFTDGTMAGAVFRGLANQAPAVIYTARSAADLTSGKAPAADTTLLLACEVEDAQAYLKAAGIVAHADAAAWLSQAAPAVVAGVVEAPARGYIFDAAGNRAAFLAGPVPADKLPLYSHGIANSYRMDNQ